MKSIVIRHPGKCAFRLSTLWAAGATECRVGWRGGEAPWPDGAMDQGQRRRGTEVEGNDRSIARPNGPRRTSTRPEATTHEHGIDATHLGQIVGHRHEDDAGQDGVDAVPEDHEQAHEERHDLRGLAAHSSRESATTSGRRRYASVNSKPKAEAPAAADSEIA